MNFSVTWTGLVTLFNFLTGSVSSYKRVAIFILLNEKVSLPLSSAAKLSEVLDKI